MTTTLLQLTENRTGLFHLGDCLEMFASQPDKSIDVIVTSPPYNLGIEYGTYQDNVTPYDYERMMRGWLTEAARVLTLDGSLFLNLGARPSDQWWPFEIAGIVQENGLASLQLQNVIHWIKAIAIGDKAMGHYKPINSQRFINDCHEYIFHFTPRCETPLDRLAIGVPYQDKSNMQRWKGAASGLRCRGNTWFIPYETIQNRDRDRPHPATFPVQLPEQCLKLHGLERIAQACDPFMGIGTTAVACARLGVNFVGAELDQAYYTEAIRRVKDETDPIHNN